MKYFYIILSCLLILFVGCSDRSNTPVYINISDRIMNEYINYMKKQYSLNLVGSGGGFLRQVNEIIIFFNFVGTKNKEELRELLVKATEELLRRYNENEEIRPYLKNYPFTVENCQIGIHLVDQEGREIHNSGSGKDNLCSIFLVEGVVIYRIENDEKIALQEVYRETYQEALDIVNRSKAD